MSVHSDFHPKYFTDWFPCTIAPVRIGVYQITVRTMFNRGPNKDPMAWAFSLWNGSSWERSGSWMDYTTSRDDFMWRGLDRNMQMPEGGVLE